MIWMLWHQFIEGVQIGYNFAIDSFKKEAKKRDHGKCYYKILNILVSPTYPHAQTQNKGKGEESEKRQRW